MKELAPEPSPGQREVTLGRRIVAVLAVVVTVAVLVGDWFFPEPRLALEDLMLKLRGRRELHPAIVFVDFETWPHPRDRIAQAIDLVHEAGARVIALDVLLESAGDTNPDRALAAAIARAGSVVLPVDLEEAAAEGQPRPLMPSMEKGAAATGIANFALDRDGTVRRVRLGSPAAPAPAGATGKGAGRPAYAQAIETVYRARTPGVDLKAPTGLSRPLVIDWAEISPAELDAKAFSPLLDDASYRRGLEQLQFFKNRIVIMGHLQASAAGDTFLTPLSRTAADRVPGAIVQANVLSNLLTGRRLDRAGTPVTLFLLLAAALAGGTAARARTGVHSAAAMAAAMGGLLALSYEALARSGLIVPAGPPLAACALAFVSMQLLAAKVIQGLPLVRQVVAMLGVATRSKVALLLIISERRASGIEFTFLFREGFDPGTPLRRSKSIALADSLRAIEARLESLLDETGGSPPEEELVELGLDIKSELLGADLLGWLSELRAPLLHLVMSADDLSVPWELARIGDQALLERFGVSRELMVEENLELPAPAIRESRLRALLVANPLPLPPGFKPLPAAEEEAAALAEELRRLAGRASVILDVDVLSGTQATLDAVLAELRSARIDLLHYSGHAVHRGQTPEKSGFLFGAGVLGPAQIRSELGGVQAPSVVFANACSTGRAAGSASDEAGNQASRLSLPAAFRDAGAHIFIGTLWPVESSSAAKFASAFYAALVAGRPAGQALAEARVAARGYWMTHAAYVMYGDPRFQVIGRDREAGPTSEVQR
jgi:CHASE2 domain-containing sensor protein